MRQESLAAERQWEAAKEAFGQEQEQLQELVAGQEDSLAELRDKANAAGELEVRVVGLQQQLATAVSVMSEDGAGAGLLPGRWVMNSSYSFFSCEPPPAARCATAFPLLVKVEPSDTMK